MANITTLLGTDSLSSSRIVINDNFTAVNDQIEDVASLLDVNTQTLELTGNVNAAGISLASGGTNRFIVNASGITLGLETTIGDTLILNNGLIHSVTESAITTMPSSYNFTTYFIDATATEIATGANIVEAGNEGQEITLIAESGDVIISTENIAGATSLTIKDKGTLTIRWHANAWYIISSFNCTIA